MYDNRPPAQDSSLKTQDSALKSQDPGLKSQTAYTLGIDTGGTFTDVVLVDGHRHIVATHKLPSTPDDPARAVLEGIDALLAKAALPDRSGWRPDVVHGSTVATNALLEGDTQGAAFVTTAGFEDTLRLARQDRPELYALVPRRPDPPIPPQRCFGVEERMGHHGRVIRPLEVGSLDTLIDQLEKAGVESVAVSLLHSYANDTHERMLADVLRERLGERLHLTVSSELLPEFREYERAATCVINAAVAPKMSRYIGRLREALGEHHLTVMGSHGGKLPADDVIREPVRTILSGPAGGVIGAASTAMAPTIISFDMGGTSTDVALCHAAQQSSAAAHLMTTQGRAAGLPVRLPMVDIHTVGAGGGSIAWVDPGGALRVGPRSAGADPGPACYGKQAASGAGELIATVTDAHVVVGHIPEGAALAGEMTLDCDAAHRAVETVARQAGLDTGRAAWGILEVAETTMARAIQQVSLERGREISELALVTFGGAGGLHACRLAERLGMRRVIIPMHPGLLSAIGMLNAPLSHTFSHHVGLRFAPNQRATLRTASAIEENCKGLRRRAMSHLSGHYGSSFGKIRWEEIEQIDLRYTGQSYEITVDLAADDPIAAFEAEHLRLYGYADPGREVEATCVRLTVASHRMQAKLPRIARRTSGPQTFSEGACIQRDELYDEDRLAGPVTVSEYSATTVVPAGWSGLVYRSGRIVLTRNAQEAQP